MQRIVVGAVANRAYRCWMGNARLQTAPTGVGWGMRGDENDGVGARCKRASSDARLQTAPTGVGWGMRGWKPRLRRWMVGARWKRASSDAHPVNPDNPAHPESDT